MTDLKRVASSPNERNLKAFSVIFRLLNGNMFPLA